MSRSKKKIKKRIVDSDSFYNSQLIQMFILRLIKKGKKRLAYKIILETLKNIKNKTQTDPIEIIEQALRYTTPSVEIKARRIGGTVNSIPVELSVYRGTSLAIRWILSSCKTKSVKIKTMSNRLANELIDNSNKIGNAVRKKEEIHKIANINIRTSKNI
uniref:Small ribosomal subunit protein uS7c n=1 Tax=Avrainvillea sp. HV04061 TaxID=2364086 RepID=A0A3B8DHQ1_9CHLO|nr:ribosomal protein S7 [Avrainvillea sp. HV04061]